MPTPTNVVVVNLASIRDQMVLLVFKKDIWILPGGKPLDGESECQCIRREIEEELNCDSVRIDSIYGEYTGKAPHSGLPLTARVYLGVVGESVIPSGEISKARYFKRDELASIPLSEVTKQVTDALTRAKFI